MKFSKEKPVLSVNRNGVGIAYDLQTQQANALTISHLDLGENVNIIMLCKNKLQKSEFINHKTFNTFSSLLVI